jgi:hypothetical protein
MKRFAFVALALLGASAKDLRADVFTPTYFRCAADQMFGHPSQQATDPEGRTGLGRTTWARTAFTYWAYGGGGSITNARRFWLPTFNTDVDTYATNFDTDLYPIYAADATGDIWVGPGPNNATWHGTTKTGIATLVGLCEAGCYMPEQQLRMGDQLMPVAQAQASNMSTVTTLTPGSTLDSLQFMGNQVGRYTVDFAPATQTIITLQTKSGGSLRVTKEHPLVTGDGVLKQAQDLVVGEALVRDTGKRDPIVSIAKADEFTKVYNLRPTTTDLTSNILVAQGFLSGSAAYQNEYLKYLNRVLLRQKIPANVIARKAP